MRDTKIWNVFVTYRYITLPHQLEEDARDMVMEATFQELKAELDIEDATELLSILKQNELALKATIQEMRKEKGAAFKEQFETHEMPKHQDFVKSVRKILQTKQIDHDPTKGNIAF
jgi:CO dehydrogenase/acetyl-CoA synthase beta subunit